MFLTYFNLNFLWAASISALDDGIGKILSSLVENNMAKDTIIIFASDVKNSKQSLHDFFADLARNMLS